MKMKKEIIKIKKSKPRAPIKCTKVHKSKYKKEKQQIGYSNYWDLIYGKY